MREAPKFGPKESGRSESAFGGIGLRGPECVCFRIQGLRFIEVSGPKFSKRRSLQVHNPPEWGVVGSVTGSHKRLVLPK